MAGEWLKNEDADRWSGFCPRIVDVVEYDTALVEEAVGTSTQAALLVTSTEKEDDQTLYI